MKSDWDLGQELVEKGVCTLDQVREALSIRDQLQRMGLKAKSLGEILVEKGFATSEQLRAVGIDVAAPAPKPRPSAVRRFERRRSSAPVAWLFAAAAAVAAGIFLFREKPPEPRVLPPPAPVAVDPDREPREELGAIAALEAASNDFGNGEEVAKRYEAFQRRWAGRRWEVEAHDRLRAYRARADVFAKKELEPVTTRESELRSSERFGELLRLYSAFPKRFLAITDTGRLVQERIAELAGRVRETYLREKAEAEKLLRDGKYAEAAERARALEGNAPSEALDELSRLRARIEVEGRAVVAKARQEVADKYLELDGRYKARLAQRPPNPRAAANEVLAFLAAPWDEHHRPFARVPGLDHVALAKAVEAWEPDAVLAAAAKGIADPPAPDRLSTAEAALLDLRNAALVELFYRDVRAGVEGAAERREALDLPGLGKGRFEKRAGKTVFVDPAGAERVDPLTEDDLAALAGRARPAGPDRDLRAGFFYFYCAPGRSEKAYEHLARAAAAGARGVQVYLGGLITSVQVEEARSLRTKFDAAKDSFAKRQWPVARRLLGEVLKRPEHPYVAEKRPEIERMLFEMSEGDERERKLSAETRGKASVLADGRIRILYDFETREQLDGFEAVTEEGARKFKGRWRIERGALESARESSVLLWKTPVKGDLELEYDLALLEEPQNVTVDLYYRKGLSRHYAVTLGFDWVGRAEGDRDNTAEDRFGMPRTCVIKYPVEADKARWVLAGQWENWKARLVGEGDGAWKPPIGKPVRMRIERKAAALRVLAGGAKIWEGSDDLYGEGQILFFSDSRVRMDNLEVVASIKY
jgi:hypothetical protein